MRLSKKEVSLNLLVVDPDSGEHLDVKAKMSFNKYYTIKKLNSRICTMKLRDVQIEICISKSSTEMFWVLIEAIDSSNCISGLTAVAEDSNTDLRRLQKMVKKMKDIGFLTAVSRGCYSVNPFIIVGKAVRKGQDISVLQESWRG